MDLVLSIPLSFGSVCWVFLLKLRTETLRIFQVLVFTGLENDMFEQGSFGIFSAG